MVGHDASERQHGLDAFAGRHDIVRHTETDGVAQEMAHRPSRRVDRRLVPPRWVEPGAMRAGDLAVEIGDGGDHRRPGLGRRHADQDGSSSGDGSGGFRFRAKP